MFTGLIEEIGVVEKFTKNASDAIISVSCSKVLDGIQLGDSISINGACQTVIDFDKKTFSTQISQETLAVTNFSAYKTGDFVNLERAMNLEKRFGGHIVNGHVDGIEKITEIKNINNFYVIKISLKNEIKKYIAPKGSITINGISLTVAKIYPAFFELAIIPHTFENTNLKYLKTGDFVNVEVDILAKYVENFLSTDNNKTLNENFLKENGFF